VVEVAKAFYDAGFKVMATAGTCGLLNQNDIPAQWVNKLSEGIRPNILDLLTNGKIDLVINTPVGKDSVMDDSYLRKAAIKGKIPYITTMAAAKATAAGITYLKNHQTEEPKSVQALHASIKDKV